MSEEKIKEIYVNNNFPSLQKLYLLVKKLDNTINKNEVKEFLDKQYNYQVLKQQNKTKQSGHIIAFRPNELWQMDIFDLKKYAPYNKNYGYLFVIVDVFTRKAGLMPMKQKSASSCSVSLQEIINKMGPPIIIMSDNDKAFLSKEFEQVLKTNDSIILDTNVKDDHKALGIIDRFARTLKTIISNYFLYNNTKVWINDINKIIDVYNNTPHRGIEYLTPNEASQDKYHEQILSLNLLKNKKNGSASDLLINDKVRIRIGNIFKKGTEPSFSDEIYDVINTDNNKILLSNGKKYKRSSLLKIVPVKAKDLNQQPTAMQPINIIKEATKTHKIKQLHNRISIDQNNVIDKNDIKNKRNIKPPAYLSNYV
jgi:hypothetical protein